MDDATSPKLIRSKSVPTVLKTLYSGSLFVKKEPLDWILFNKVLDRMTSAKPRSHGNYVESLELAGEIIEEELACFGDLDMEDIPAFLLVFISDGVPSDNLPEHQDRRKQVVMHLAHKLKSKLTVFGMGIGASGSDFEQLQLLVDAADENGSNGEFNHAGLNPASLSTSFSSIATSMTSTRNELLSTKDGREPKMEKNYTMRKKKSEIGGQVSFRREAREVSRWLYDDSKKYPWKEVPFFNGGCVGFDMERDPFGKGVERLAYMFYEIKPKAKGVGNFCRVQNKANEFAKLFNEAVKMWRSGREIPDRQVHQVQQ